MSAITPKPTGLAKKLTEVTAALDWTKKQGRNKEQGYDFVRAVDIFADVRGELATRGVAFMFSTKNMRTTIMPRDNRSPSYLTEMEADYSFIDGDTGEVLTGEFVGSAIDTSDKGPWKCITAMLKYIAISVFLLPTGDDPERDEKTDNHQATSATPRAVSQPASRAASVGLTLDQKRKLFALYTQAGLKGDQIKWFQYEAIQKFSTSQMTNQDMDQLVTLLETDEGKDLIERALLIEPERAKGNVPVSPAV
jgi:hypothetical protein